MPKRLSNLERVVDFFLNGSPEEVNSAFATVNAIMRAKTPAKTTPTGNKPGRKRKDSQPSLPTNGE